MDGLFGPDRGVYVEPNFSFEDTFCREITSCLDPYEEDARVNARARARMSTELGSLARNPGIYNKASARFDSNIPNTACLQNIENGANVLNTSDSSFEEDNIDSGEFDDGFAFDSSHCSDEQDPGSDSPTGTWSAEEEPNNEVPSPRGRVEPMKKIRRLRANDRERRRMRSLNRALDSLKKCIPVPQSKRRVTKLEILRIACNYIKSLSETLRGDASGSNSVFRKRARPDTVVNGFSVAQRLEILSGNGAPRI